MTRTRLWTAAPITLSIGFGAAVFALDLALPLGAGIGAVYVVMVIMGMWSPWRCAPLLLASAATTLIVLAGALSSSGGRSWSAMPDKAIALLAIWFAALLLTRPRPPDPTLASGESAGDDGVRAGSPDATATAGRSAAPATGAGGARTDHGDHGAADLASPNGAPALGPAKGGRHRRLHFLTSAITAETRSRRNLERDLRRGLERDQLTVLYQPQFDLQSGRIVGVEALARWRHPRHGSVPPAVFIPVAEATGLIRPLGAYVLREACRQATAWRDGGCALGVAVNLSPAQLLCQDLTDQLARVLGATGLEPHRLELELTENVFLDPARRPIAAILERVVDLGVSLTIDDFGTGYASFAYLKSFPVTKIKINGAFVHDIGRDRGDEAIVEAIVALGHSLGKRVIAEGVETEAQLAFLRDRGCDLAQGFLLGRPHTPEDLGRFLAGWPEAWRALKAAVGPVASATGAGFARSRRRLLH